MLDMGEAASRDTCASFCAGSRYMGLQSNTLCYCGDSYGKYEQQVDDACGVLGSSCGQDALTPRVGACFEQMTVSIVTKTWSSEIQWIFSGDPERVFSGYGDHQTQEEVITADPMAGGHTIQFIDTFGDGWHGGYWTLLNTATGDILAGGLEDGQISGRGTVFEWSGPMLQCDAQCAATNAVFKLPYWRCADVSCASVGLANADAATTNVVGLSDAEAHAICCLPSCNEWEGSCGDHVLIDDPNLVLASDDPATACCVGSCQAGQWSTGGVCQPCDAGTFSDTTMATACSSCPAGSVSFEGSSQCTPCVAGTYHNGAAESCSPCLSGSFSAVGATSCDACVAGTFDDDSSAATPCILCEANQYSAPQATECLPCLPGTTSAGGATACTPARETFLELVCPTQWVDCQANAACVQQYAKMLASPDRPAFGNAEATALFACLTQARESGTSPPPEGCVDPTAMNYAPTAVLDDQTCIYSCAGMIERGSLPTDTVCYSYDASGEELHSYPIELSTVGLNDNDSFWTSLGQDTHVIIQGPIIQGSLGTGPVGGGTCTLDLLNDVLSWDGAELACIGEGGHLATILDESQQQLVDALVSDDDTKVWCANYGPLMHGNRLINGAGLSSPLVFLSLKLCCRVLRSCRIGMNDRIAEAGCNEEEFAWSDGSSGLVTGHWAPGEPDAWGCGDTLTSGSDCQAVFRSNTDCVITSFAQQLWEDVSCASRYPYMCGFSCDGEEAYTCSFSFFEEQLPWADAEAACVAGGGHLAGMHSQADHDLLMEAVPDGTMQDTFLNRFFWIGLSDQEYEMGCDGGDDRERDRAICNPPSEHCARNIEADSWMWADGTAAVDFFSWSGAFPQSFSDSIVTEACGTDCVGASSCLKGNSFENCVFARGGSSWHDALCAETHQFICGHPCLSPPIARVNRLVTLTDASTTFRSLEFSGAALGQGAGISCVNSNMTAIYSVFSGFEQRGAGAGAIFAEASRITLAFSVIQNNVNTGSGSAGVVAMLSSEVIVQSTRVEANEAYDAIGLDSLTAFCPVGSHIVLAVS